MRRIIAKGMSRIQRYQFDSINMHPIVIFGGITIGGLLLGLVHILIQALAN